MGWRGRWLADGLRQADLPASRGGGRELNRRRGPSQLPGLVDSHAHLQHSRFDADRDAVVERAREAGIARILVPGWDLASSEAAIELAERHPGFIDAAVGIHPHDAAGMDEAGWARLDALAADPRNRAVGEIGLDFHRNLSAPDVQREALARQLDLARRLRLPVLVHDRDAHEEVTGMLERWASPDRPRGLLHAFSGGRAMAERLIGAGFIISFALPVAFRSALGPREAAAAVAEGTFVVETDSPYLGPDAAARNEPTTAIRVTAELSRLRGVAVENLVTPIRTAYGTALAG
ncbi:MAG TPA: TatD family hydrolase [Candidatus Limnocylindria bacterium]|nr:TatD family hydrolase [Candidatus Limnocylindria bacterium]